MAALGVVVVFVFGLANVLGGALNLMECGDRIGPKYRKSNIAQVVIGFALMAGSIYFK